MKEWKGAAHANLSYRIFYSMFRRCRVWAVRTNQAEVEGVSKESRKSNLKTKVGAIVLSVIFLSERLKRLYFIL